MANVNDQDLKIMAEVFHTHVVQFALHNRIPAEAICGSVIFALAGVTLGLAQGNEKVARDILMTATEKAIAKFPEMLRRARNEGNGR